MLTVQIFSVVYANEFYKENVVNEKERTEDSDRFYYWAIKLPTISLYFIVIADAWLLPNSIYSLIVDGNYEKNWLSKFIDTLVEKKDPNPTRTQPKTETMRMSELSLTSSEY